MVTGTTNLPDYEVLDKVYDGWRNLVADGSVNRFMEIKITGALNTKMFGISGRANATIASIPGLSPLFSGSKYSDFTMAMAEARGHRLALGSDGFFGTMVPTVTVPENNRFGTGVYKDSLYTSSLGMFENLNLSVFDSDVTNVGTWAPGVYAWEGNLSYIPRATKNLSSGDILKISPGSALHGDILSRCAELIDKHNLRIAYKAPMLLAAGNLGHENYGMDKNGPMHSLCLPGLKPVVFWFDGTESNVGTVDTFNNTVMLQLYVEDNGTNTIYGFRFQSKTGAHAVLMNDNRYIGIDERVSGQGWHSNGADLAAVFGPEFTWAGVKYSLASVQDGKGKSPTITSVGGSYYQNSTGFIPLLGIPGKMDYLFMGTVTDAGEESYLVDGKEVYVAKITVDCKEFLVEYDYSWYEMYYKTGFGVYTPRNSNIQTNTLESWAEVKNYNLAVYGSKTQYSLTEADVKRTNLYRKYKKAQDKACREDKFLTLPFDDANTYAQMLSKSKPSNVFMNLVGGTQVTEVPFKLEMGKITMVSGTPTFTVAGGSAEAINDERYMEIVLQGIPRLPAAETALGLDPKEVTAQVGDKDVNTTVSLTSFTGKDDRFLWMDKEGAMVNGFPIIPAMTVDQRMVALGLNATQFNSMLQPTIRLIESLTADKLWIRFK